MKYATMFLVVALGGVSATAPLAQESSIADLQPYKREITSPDGTIKVDVSVKNEISYSVDLDGKPLVVPSLLGLSFGDTLELGRNAEAVDSGTTEHNETLKDDFGKFSRVEDHYRELRMRLREIRPSPQPPVNFELIVRAYDQGVALRYILPKQDALNKFEITEDLTQILFARNYRAWVGANTGYETPFPEVLLNQLSEKLRSLPLVVETDHGYVAVAEADVRDWSGASLEGIHTPGVFGVRASLISPVESETPRPTPWHALLIARRPV